jgi:cold-inducible RNA-binding protein
MNTRLYVGNLSGSVTEASLRELFSQKGTVTDIKLMLDPSTGLSRGFAFVTMATPELAESALKAFHSTKLGERYITVTEARPQEERTTGLIGQGFETGRGPSPGKSTRSNSRRRDSRRY